MSILLWWPFIVILYNYYTVIYCTWTCICGGRLCNMCWWGAVSFAIMCTKMRRMQNTYAYNIIATMLGSGYIIMHKHAHVLSLAPFQRTQYPLQPSCTCALWLLACHPFIVYFSWTFMEQLRAYVAQLCMGGDKGQGCNNSPSPHGVFFRPKHLARTLHMHAQTTLHKRMRAW